MAYGAATGGGFRAPAFDPRDLRGVPGGIPQGAYGGAPGNTGMGPGVTGAAGPAAGGTGPAAGGWAAGIMSQIPELMAQIPGGGFTGGLDNVLNKPMGTGWGSMGTDLASMAPGLGPAAMRGTAAGLTPEVSAGVTRPPVRMGVPSSPRLPAPPMDRNRGLRREERQAANIGEALRRAKPGRGATPEWGGILPGGRGVGGWQGGASTGFWSPEEARRAAGGIRPRPGTDLATLRPGIERYPSAPMTGGGFIAGRNIRY